MFCVTVTTLPGGLQTSQEPSLRTALALASDAATWLLPKSWPAARDSTPAYVLTPPDELPPQTPGACRMLPLPLTWPSSTNRTLLMTRVPLLRMLLRLISPWMVLALFLLSEVAMTLGELSALVLVPIWKVTPGSMVSTGGLVPAMVSA